jgi:hypothetical protein
MEEVLCFLFFIYMDPGLLPWNWLKTVTYEYPTHILSFRKFIALACVAMGKSEFLLKLYEIGHYANNRHTTIIMLVNRLLDSTYLIY